MFTGIVQAMQPVKRLERRPGLLAFAVAATEAFVAGLKTGASVAVNGACLTVTRIDGTDIAFDAVQETLDLSNLRLLEEGTLVNLERAARADAEVGGHLLSGHLVGAAPVAGVQKTQNNVRLLLQGDPAWLKFVFEKGYLAVNGASLTVAALDRAKSQLAINLIPETLARTNLGALAPGDLVNIEVDAQTQAIVETVERVLAERPPA